MCQLGIESKEFTLTEKSALECFRWFQCYQGKLTPVANSINPWVNKIVKSDFPPELNINGSFQDDKGQETCYSDRFDPIENKYVKNTVLVAPKIGNSNGLYCYKTEKDALNDGSSSYMILARIKVWGKIVEHSNGYRAEFAEIQELFPSKTFKDVVHVTKKKSVTSKKKVLNKRTKTLTTVTTVVTTTKTDTFTQAFRKAMPKLKHVKISRKKLNKF